MPDIIRKIKNPELYLKFDSELCPLLAQNLIAKILKTDPLQRPRIEDILEDDFLVPQKQKRDPNQSSDIKKGDKLSWVERFAIPFNGSLVKDHNTSLSTVQEELIKRESKLVIVPK